MSDLWRLAVLDSGVAVAVTHSVEASRAFESRGDRVEERDAVPDVLGHGSTVVGIICGGEVGGRIALYNGQVLHDSRRTTPACVAAGLRWAVKQGAHLVNLSLGLRQDRQVLREACEAASKARVIVVAASPARGARVFPASYPGVIRATGDARCAENQISWLDSIQADFGACARVRSGNAPTIAGASVGAAYLSRYIVEHCRPGDRADQVRERLRALASYRGPERVAGGERSI